MDGHVPQKISQWEEGGTDGVATSTLDCFFFFFGRRRPSICMSKHLARRLIANPILSTLPLRGTGKGSTEERRSEIVG